MLYNRLVSTSAEESMLVAGEWRGSGDGSRFEVTDPATGDVVGSVPDACDGDVRATIDAAGAALEDWRSAPAVERARLLRRSADLIRERTDRIAAVMTAEQGKPDGSRRRGRVRGRVLRVVCRRGRASPHGVIVATEGFGNNHIDWAHAIGAILRHGTPTVGVTWAARQGKLVVGSEYLVALVETNRSADGRETLRLGENTATAADADRAVAMLRTFIAGIDIDRAPAEWDPAVIAEPERETEAGDGGLCEHLRSEIPVPQLVTPPLAPLKVPLSETRIALISAAGPLVVGDQPFKPAGDSTFRERYFFPGALFYDVLFY
jgi:Aldehyde dehydrogenase family